MPTRAAAFAEAISSRLALRARPFLIRSLPTVLGTESTSFGGASVESALSGADQATVTPMEAFSR